jgi:hypothetical protein
LRSLEPCESFVRFFLRNPRLGMGAAAEECCRQWTKTLRVRAELRAASCAALSSCCPAAGDHRLQRAAARAECAGLNRRLGDTGRCNWGHRRASSGHRLSEGG